MPPAPTPATPRATGKVFVRPTIGEVTAYCRERGNLVDPAKWLDHYTANGWKVGKNTMRDWRAAVRTWERQDGFNAPATAPTPRRENIPPVVSQAAIDAWELELAAAKAKEQAKLELTQP